jgi:protein-disulfide isomerase
MSKRNQADSKATDPATTAPRRPSRLRAWTSWLPTTVAVAALVAIAYVNGRQTRALGDRIDYRLDEIDTQISQLSLKVDKVRTLAPSARVASGPDPNRVYAVKTEGAPVEGPLAAAVTIAEFSDFQWPFCARVGPTLDQIRKTYGDNVRIVWKNFPLDFHKDASLAAVAAAAANDQGKFWEYHDKLFKNQPKIQKQYLLQYARELKLDMKRFEQALNTLQGDKVIQADIAEGKVLGVSGTPAFFVNGRFLNGAKPFDEFVKVIDAELTRLKLPIPPKKQA